MGTGAWHGTIDLPMTRSSDWYVTHKIKEFSTTTDTQAIIERLIFSKYLTIDAQHFAR